MGARILVVDDSSAIRFMLAGILKDAGFDVQTASDGFQGLLSAREFAPNLIFADLNMPKQNGLSMTRKLREEQDFSDTPILILTTDNQPEMKKEGRKAGATGWIVKPIGPEQLLSIVHKFLP